MSQWLLGNGLADITTQDRYRALIVIENINAIEAWRSGLNDAQRRLNHLNAVWHASLRTTTPRSAPPPPRQHVVKGSKPHKTGKPIYWPQDVIRRAATATAMRESMSNDWTKLARCALETVNRDDLLALLNAPAPTRAPAKLTRVEAVALA
jgi:hypothetical protein